MDLFTNYQGLALAAVVESNRLAPPDAARRAHFSDVLDGSLDIVELLAVCIFHGGTLSCDTSTSPLCLLILLFLADTPACSSSLDLQLLSSWDPCCI
jgi:hypothetical protein